MEKQKNPFKIQYFLALFVLLCIGAFLACKNDMITDDYLRSSVQPSTSIAKFEGTKTWFSSYLNSPAVASSSKYREMKPVWEQAKMVNNHIEVPFTIDSKMGIPTINDGLKRVGKQFLLIGNPAAPKKGYIVNIMPTLDFKGDMKNITLDNYRKEGFSGVITVRNLNGQAMEGVEYKNGKFKSKLKARSNDTKSLQVRQTCEWKEELYDCGTVCVGGYCGEPQCSSRFYLDCWGDDDDGDGDGDPCLGQNPPLYCSGDDDPCNRPNPPLNCNGDPCNGPNPPPNCGDIGDTDPCKGPNPPADCNECICNKQSEELPVNVVLFDLLHKDYVTLVLTSMDCKTGDATKDLSHFVQSSYPSAITFANEYVRDWYKVPIDVNKPNCGYNVTYICHSVVTSAAWLPSQQNLPVALTVHNYVGTNID